MPICGDRVRLTQVFSKLLDNASKYSPDAGNITLEAKYDAESLTVKVIDKGIGIRDSVFTLPKVV
jgi:signal transduction histidine kinase